MRRIVAITLLALVGLAGLAMAADERSIFDPSRGQLAAGLNYDSYNAFTSSHDVLPAFRREWSVGVYGAWNLVEELDLVSYAKVGLDSHIFGPGIGVRYTFWSGAHRTTSTNP